MYPSSSPSPTSAAFRGHFRACSCASSTLRVVDAVGGLAPRCRVAYVESIARVYRLSLTGKILNRTRLADAFFVQWEDLRGAYPRATYAGRLMRPGPGSSAASCLAQREGACWARPPGRSCHSPCLWGCCERESLCCRRSHQRVKITVAIYIYLGKRRRQRRGCTGATPQENK